MTLNKKLKIIVIIGPTASGKSGLGIMLAQKFGGEIISADSRQVYQGMDIGTGKVTKKEMAGIPHHLLNVASPKNQFSAAKYKKLAEKAVAAIHQKKRVPIIVGGTGFYIDTLLYPELLSNVPPNQTLRVKLKKKTIAELSSQLKKMDKRAWTKIDQKNPRRLIRAIELVTALGSVPQNNFQERPDWEVLTIGLNPDHTLLKKKIRERLLARFRRGMIAEVKKLKQTGLSWRKLDDFGLEYRHIALFLQNKTSKTEMLKNLECDIGRYAKRQMTWFKRNKKIYWLKSSTEAQKLVSKFLKTN